MSVEHAEVKDKQSSVNAPPLLHGASAPGQAPPEVWQVLQQSIGNRALGRLIEGRDEEGRRDESEAYSQPGSMQRSGFAAAARQGVSADMLSSLQGTMGNSFVGRVLQRMSDGDRPPPVHIEPSHAPAEVEALPRLDDEEPQTAEAASTDAQGAAGDAGDDDDDTGPKSGTIDPIAGEAEERPGACDEIEEALQVMASLNISAGTRQHEMIGGSRQDTVDSAINIKSSVAQGGTAVPATSFGHEEPKYDLGSSMWVKQKGKVIKIEAEILLECHWDIQSQGRTDVSGPDSPVVTEKTWDKIAKDLMPNDGGWPARDQYYADDLTRTHEQFHASDDIKQAQKYLPDAIAWLNGHVIDGEGDITAQVEELLEQVRGMFASDGNNHSQAGGEGRAYDDGKASYEQRANAIRSRGIREKWHP